MTTAAFSLREPYASALYPLAQVAGDVANYADHAEHCEPLERDWVVGGAESLLALAVRLSAQLGTTTHHAYAARLKVIEQRNLAYARVGAHASYRGWADVPQSESWRELQRVQQRHDRAYHADVIGMARAEQLRHHAFHVAKLAGLVSRMALSEDEPDEPMVNRLIGDLVIFGLTLSTVMNQPLSAEPIGVPSLPAGSSDSAHLPVLHTDRVDDDDDALDATVAEDLELDAGPGELPEASDERAAGDDGQPGDGKS